MALQAGPGETVYTSIDCSGKVCQLEGQGQVEQVLYAADKYGLDDLASTFKTLLVINLWPR
jgi:hypothetical protein